MSRFILTTIFALISIFPVFSQYYKITGKLVTPKGKPIELASVVVAERELWTITNESGEFVLRNVPQGKVTLIAHSLGYVKKTFELDVQYDISDLTLHLAEDNLALEEVVVTAQRKTGDMTTSYLIDRTTLDHAQTLNITDITSLLPGGKTPLKNNLASESDDRFNIRSSKSEKGNPSFGTAVEVDGVRLNGNSSLDETNGASTRNISTINIESVEVITGIPSVEYGDLTNGIVKINTRKGKTPLTIELATKPNTKQYAAGKGFLLGTNAGVLNTSIERTESTSDLASPYTTYDRNTLSLNYSKAFNQDTRTPLNLTAGLTGNIGGYNQKSDPDNLKESYRKNRDNTIRGNLKLNWLLNQSWITNLELSGSFSYSDKLLEVNKFVESATSQPAMHSTEEGYYLSQSIKDNYPTAPIIQLPTGEWYQLSFAENKPINYSLKAKADWIRKFNNITNKVLFGVDFQSSGNKGRGLYYDDINKAATWREYQYKDLPYTNNLAIYAEDKLTIPTNSVSTLQLTAGLRSDITMIRESEYGTVNSLSPRFNAKYTFWKNQKDKIINSLSIHAGWGKAVKLPSFEVLYPSPTYGDMQSFSHSLDDKGIDAIYAYHTIPVKTIYNPDLKWQYSQQTELGLDANILGAEVSISAFWNKTFNPYIAVKSYSPYTFRFTNSIGKDFIIPVDDRSFSIDHNTGIITVSDKSGHIADQQLAYQDRDSYKSSTMYTNGSPIKRSGIEWSIDFPQIKAIRTSFRLDGNYYYYKGVEENLISWMPSSSVTMGDGTPYRYVGYYTGTSTNSTSSVLTTSATGFSKSAASASVANGRLTKEVNTNFTIMTHIPKVRLIISMKLEASLYNYSQSLSEYEGGTRAFVLQDQNGYDTSNQNIYEGGRVAIHPLYYSTWEEPDVKIPFTEKFNWAKDNDPQLYKHLAQLVIKTTNTTDFTPNKISAYFSTNLSVTKEIGDFASVSFYANNFFNTMARVKSSKEDTQTSLYNSSLIPKFYYGLSLRIKI